ncbi:MAG: MFS transporter [Thaumarchaeota archaeon]|nr:MFS transporter [Nitrososphaerota archaeon]
MTRDTTPIYLVAFFVVMGLSIIVPALPLYARDLGASDIMIGGLIAGFGIARVIFDVPAGMFAEKISQRKVLQIGLGIIAVSSLGAALATSYWLLLAARILEGVGSALYVTTAATIITSSTELQKRGRVMSYYTAAILLGGTIGPAVGGVVTPIWGKNSPFLVYALLATIGMIISHYSLSGKDQEIPKEEKSDGFRIMLFERSVLLVSLATFAMAFLWTGLELTVVPIFAYDNLSLDSTSLGLVLTLSALANLFSTLVIGRLTDRFGRKAPMVAGYLASALSAYLLSTSMNLGDFLFYGIFYGLATGVWGQTSAWAADISPKERMGTMMGINRMMGDLGFVIGPLALGFLSGQRSGAKMEPYPFFATAALIAIVGILLVFARDPAKRKIEYVQSIPS